MSGPNNSGHQAQYSFNNTHQPQQQYYSQSQHQQQQYYNQQYYPGQQQQTPQYYNTWEQPQQQQQPPHQQQQQQAYYYNQNQYEPQRPQAQAQQPLESLSRLLPGTPSPAPAPAPTQLMPVRFENMAGRGARTKAGMRKLMQEQNNLAKQAPVAVSVKRDTIDEAIEAALSSPGSSKEKKVSPPKVKAKRVRVRNRAKTVQVNVKPEKKSRKKRKNKREPVKVESPPSSESVVEIEPPTKSILERRPIVKQELKPPTVRGSRRVPLPQPSASGSSSKEGPSLRVKHGTVKFYRGMSEAGPSMSQPQVADRVPPLEVSKQTPWVCVFCNLGPHDYRLGDLFGPYYVETRRDPGGASQRRETWVHTDCALWAGDVILVGDTLRNLDSAVKEADRIECLVCTKVGATIGCLKKGCSETAHFPCAKANGWVLDELSYHSYCRDHRALAFGVKK